MLYLYDIKSKCETVGQKQIIKDIMNYGIQSCNKKNRIINPDFNIESRLYERYHPDCNPLKMCFIPKEQYYKHDAARLNSFV